MAVACGYEENSILGYFFFLQIYNLLYNGAISKYVIRKHLC
jgi:hypothetical protein